MHFWKFTHFDKIEIFQFLTNFTKFALVSHIRKLRKLAFSGISEKIAAIGPFRFVNFIFEIQNVWFFRITLLNITIENKNLLIILLFSMITHYNTLVSRQWVLCHKLEGIYQKLCFYKSQCLAVCHILFYIILNQSDCLAVFKTFAFH